MSSDLVGVAVVDLTDEEITALDPVPVEQRLAVMPWFDELDEQQQELAVITAFRGLVARGLVEAPDGEDVERAVASGEERPEVTIAVSPEIANVLVLRRKATRAVVAQRTAGERQDFLYLYEAAEDVVLAELVEPKGLHRFGLLEAAGLRPALEAYLLAGDWEGGDGEPVIVGAAEAADGAAPPGLLGMLADCWVQAEFVVRPLESVPSRLLVHGLSAGPDGIFLTRIVYGAGEPVAVTPSSRATARRWLEEALA